MPKSIPDKHLALHNKILHILKMMCGQDQLINDLGLKFDDYALCENHMIHINKYTTSATKDKPADTHYNVYMHYTALYPDGKVRVTPTHIHSAISTHDFLYGQTILKLRKYMRKYKITI